MFLQLRADKGVDYCLSDFGFFLTPFRPCRSDARIGGRSILGPDLSGAPWHFTIRFMKLTVMNATSVTAVTGGFISLRSRGSLPPPCNIYIYTVIYTQMEVYVRMGDWWGENYQWWCQAWIGEKRVFVIIALAALQGRSSCEEALPVSSSLFDEARYHP